MNEMANDEAAPLETVEAFLDAFAVMDFARALSLLTATRRAHRPGDYL